MLSRRAREFAAEISSHDWSDAPYRLDRAGHDRRIDRTEGPELSRVETDRVRTNVMWVVAQVLKHEDPNLDLWEFAAACGVPRSISRRSDGSLSGVISHGLRWDDTEKVALAPGRPLWRARVQVDVANLVLFRRLLGQELDAVAGHVDVDVESIGGSRQVVTVTVQAWDERTAGERAAGLVAAAVPQADAPADALLLDVIRV